MCNNNRNETELCGNHLASLPAQLALLCHPPASLMGRSSSTPRLFAYRLPVALLLVPARRWSPLHALLRSHVPCP